jgi:predicted site-specific integrase-resolvase
MGDEGAITTVIIAVLGLVGSVLVARISAPQERTALERAVDDADEADRDDLKVSREIWRRFSVLEDKVDRLTLIVEQQKEKVTYLERLLRMAMRLVRRANRRLATHGELPEEVPRELVPYSID